MQEAARGGGGETAAVHQAVSGSDVDDTNCSSKQMSSTQPPLLGMTNGNSDEVTVAKAASEEECTGDVDHISSPVGAHPYGGAVAEEEPSGQMVEGGRMASSGTAEQHSNSDEPGKIVNTVQFIVC